jgi:hypothetical protein
MKNSAHLKDESGYNMSVRFVFPLIMIYFDECRWYETLKRVE